MRVDEKEEHDTNLPFVAQLLNQIGDIVHSVISSFVVEHGIETQLILERVTRQRASQFLIP